MKLKSTKQKPHKAARASLEVTPIVKSVASNRQQKQKANGMKTQRDADKVLLKGYEVSLCREGAMPGTQVAATTMWRNL